MEKIFSYEKQINYYQLLGCSDTSSRDQILAEFRARVLEAHPDKNPLDPLADGRFKLLLQAKECLTDPEMRRRYDAWLCSGMAMPFESWIELWKNVHTSMHWATCSKNEDKMIECANASDDVTWTDGTMDKNTDEDNRRYRYGQQAHVVDAVWKRDPSPNMALQMFRNYEI